MEDLENHKVSFLSIDRVSLSSSAKLAAIQRLLKMEPKPFIIPGPQEMMLQQDLWGDCLGSIDGGWIDDQGNYRSVLDDKGESDSSPSNEDVQEAILSSKEPLPITKMKQKQNKEQGVQAPQQVAASHGEDSREAFPRNWAEVRCLQTALNPSIFHFTLLTGRTPRMPAHWHSYNNQWEHLQKQLDRFLGMKSRQIKESQLVRLGKWTGGISNEAVATKLRQRTHVDEFNRREPTRTVHDPGSVAWAERNEVADLYEEACETLRQSCERSKDTQGQSPNIQAGGPPVSQGSEVFDDFLCSEGLEIFKQVAWKQGWDDWCKQDAPAEFEIWLASGGSVEMDEAALPGAYRSKASAGESYHHVTLDTAEKAYMAWNAHGRPKQMAAATQQTTQIALNHSLTLSDLQGRADALQKLSLDLTRGLRNIPEPQEARQMFAFSPDDTK